MENSQEAAIKIYTYYLRQEVEETVYPSPIPANIRGRVDRTPSFGLKMFEDKLKWKDFGFGASGDCWDFLMLVEPSVTNLAEAKRHYELHIKDLNIKIKPFKKREVRKAKEFKAFARDHLKDWEKKFWERFLIPEEQVIREYIYASEGLQFEHSDKVYYKSTPENPVFIYDLLPEKPLTTIKIYQPYNKDQKWRNWWSDNPITGTYATTLPDKAKKLIMVSSRKDKMVLNNAGFAGDNLLGESDYYKIKVIVPEYNSKFSSTNGLMDGDKAGRKCEKMLEELYAWKGLGMRYPKGCKDLAEISERYGYGVLRALINEALEKQK